MFPSMIYSNIQMTQNDWSPVSKAAYKVSGEAFHERL